jgi:cyclophilin family peptidyl-prolyl cis-trans isomerase
MSLNLQKLLEALQVSILHHSSLFFFLLSQHYVNIVVVVVFVIRIKYYNGCLFHTVQKDFTAQTGDPTGTGTAGDSIYK